MEKKKDIIDRHSKSRAMLIEDTLLLNSSTEYFISEIIDIAEISDYFDAIILSDNVGFMKKVLNDKIIESAIVVKKFENIDEIRKKYRFLIMMCSKSNSLKMKEFYKCETLIH